MKLIISFSISLTADFGCYYHECFLRGHPRLTILMRRISPGQGKATPNAYEEPDFYMTAKQFPLHPTGEEPLFSPENDKFEDKKEGEVVTNKVEPMSQEETKLDPLAAPNHKNMDDSIEPNQNNLDSVDMAWTRVAPICMEDGLCPDPHCHGSNDNEQQYSEGMVPAEDAPPGIPYLQSLLHNLLVYKDENSDGLSQNPLPLIDFVDEDSLDQMLMNMPEQDLALTHVDYSSHDFP
jgi:hypothetical protein